MTKLPPLFGDIKDLDKVFVGFSDTYSKFAKIHDDLTKSIPNYPPYNIRKTGENTYSIEIAVAGFARQDIDIEIDGGNLIIKGTSQPDDTADFLFKGIANRAFTRTFPIEENIEVKNAEMYNGMLKVFMERIIPEHRKPVKVEIKAANEMKEAAKEKKEAQLLQERTRKLEDDFEL